MREFERVIDGLAARTDVKALLLLSAKPGIFIAGADVNEIAKADQNADPEMIRGGHRTFNKLANLPFPTVAAIGGACVGGGCETALSMDWRLASDSPKTQIGLPEIKLGILPAWGGTTRLPRMIGLANALDVILAGEGSRRKAREEDRPRGRGRPGGDPRGLGEGVRPREVRHEEALERGAGRRARRASASRSSWRSSSRGPAGASSSRRRASRS